MVTRRREVATRRRRGPVRRGTQLPQELQTAEMFGGACPLPVVLNRLVPLIEVFMFIQIITVASELKLGFLLPSFFSSGPTSGPPSGMKENWKTESGKEISFSQFRQAAIRSAHSEIKNLLADSDESVLPISHERFISFCEIHQKPLNGVGSFPTLRSVQCPDTRAPSWFRLLNEYGYGFTEHFSLICLMEHIRIRTIPGLSAPLCVLSVCGLYANLSLTVNAATTSTRDDVVLTGHPPCSNVCLVRQQTALFSSENQSHQVSDSLCRARDF